MRKTHDFADVEKAIREVVETVDQAGHLCPGHKTGMRYAVVDPIRWALTGVPGCPGNANHTGGNKKSKHTWTDG